jgi:hypothetical protein
MRNHKERNTKWHKAVEVIGKACGKAASISIGSSGLKVTGLFHFYPNVIYCHSFSIANISITQRVETDPKLSASSSNKFREPETSAS